MPLVPRSLLLLGLAALLAPLAGAQTITTDPACPAVVDQPITLTFNAAGTGLEGFTGDVFAHTGLVTDRSTSDTDWRYVKNNWPQNTSDVQLTRQDTDTYTLAIPDIRAYYSDNNTGAGAVPTTEQIQKLAFVFRDDDGGKQTGNLFVDLANDLGVCITSPASDGINPVFVTDPGGLDLRATATTAGTGTIASMRVEVDGVQVAQSSGSSIEFTLAPSAPGRYTVGVTARTEDGREATETFVAVRNPEVVTEARPAGLEDGITYSADGTSATLSLYAPGKDFVYVIGDFTNWEVDLDYFMKRATDGAGGTWYWLEIDGLKQGQEVGFQYLVDGEIRVADPYAEKVLTINDQYISDATYPDLKPYPTDETVHAVGVLQPGAAEYDWQVEDFEAPEPHELVIYELLLRDFLAAHDYDTLIDTLDYIERLGVNAIELMPVSEFDGNESWGYNPSFHFALDKYYGPAEDFKRFVDAAHQRGLAVLLDVVYNHATGQSPIIRLWNEGDFGAPTADNPYANTAARHPFNVFNDLNHESEATQYWLDRANKFWLEEYRVDGFRFDLSKGFTQTQTCNSAGENCDVAAWGNYDQSRVNLLTRMTDRIWEVDPDALVIFEHFGSNAEEEVFAEYRVGEGLPGILLWSNLNGEYQKAIKGEPSDLSRVHYSNREGWDVAHNVAYMESHDEERLMYEALQRGASSSTYNVKDLGTALDRMAMAGAFFYTVPGPKMLWQFGEVGYDVSINENGRTGNKPIRWDYWSDAAAPFANGSPGTLAKASAAERAMRRDLYDAWADVLALRNAHDLFTDPATDVDLDVDGTVKRITLRHPTNGESAVIVGNFNVISRPLTFAFPTTGTWYDFYDGSSFNVTSGIRSMTLAPGEFHVYTSMEPKAGPFAVSTDGGPIVDPLPEGLNTVYPNPTAGRATVRLVLHGPRDVQVHLVDMLGRRVRTLASGLYAEGVHDVAFATDGLPTGVYAVTFGGQSLRLTVAR